MNASPTTAGSEERVSPKPRCAVRGQIRPGAMCGSVIVGMEFCGFKGKCEHQRFAVEEPALGTSPSPLNERENKR